jgi:K+-transporting ATPase KdpF subunit
MCASAKRSANHQDPQLFAMETAIIGLIALGCLAYLVVSVLRPEKF